MPTMRLRVLNCHLRARNDPAMALLLGEVLADDLGCSLEGVDRPCRGVWDYRCLPLNLSLLILFLWIFCSLGLVLRLSLSLQRVWHRLRGKSLELIHGRLRNGHGSGHLNMVWNWLHHIAHMRRGHWLHHMRRGHKTLHTHVGVRHLHLHWVHRWRRLERLSLHLHRCLLHGCMLGHSLSRLEHRRLKAQGRYLR